MSGVRRRTAAGLSLGLVAVAMSWGSSLASDQRGAGGSSPVDVDIDGDGQADLVIGSPGLALQVAYGDGDRQRVTAQSLRRPGDYGLFAFDLVTCDVNGDGFSDIVAGAQQATAGHAQFSGQVVVLYGARSGLSPRRISVLSQATPGVPGVSEEDDAFGGSLECGRVDADRFDDVIVGVFGESLPGRSGDGRHGRVIVVPGGAEGAVPAHSWSFDQNTPGIPDDVEDGDGFGGWLLLDDVTGDGRNELMVTAAEQGGGAVFVLPGTVNGVRTRGTTVIYGSTDGRPLLFGPLVAGNFDRRGPRDVIVGGGRFDPTEGGVRDAVTMLRGTPSGLTSTGSLTIRRASPGMPRLVQGVGEFGGTLDAGDVDGDGDDDLLVGSQFEKVRRVGSAGRVFLFRGAGGGITTEDVETFTQATPGVPGRPRPGAGFGRCAELINLDRDARTEAAISTWDIFQRPIVPGTVTILPATSSGLTAREARRLYPAGFGGIPGEGFGCDLAG